MAIVRRFTQLVLEKDSPHKETDCTYSIVVSTEGTKYLQLDTYGSSDRVMPGKKSQSLRFTPEAIEQLRRLIAEHF